MGNVSLIRRNFDILKLFPGQIKVKKLFFFLTFPCCRGIENYQTWKNQTDF